MNLKDLQYRFGLNETMIDMIVWIHSLLLYVFDALLFLVPKGRQKGRSVKLLIVKLDAIGDFILWLDFARGLRELYPAESNEVTLCANQVWADFAAGIPLFDKVMPIERMKFILNPVYRFKTLMKVRRQGFDILIDPAFSREFQYSPAVARVSGAKVRISPQGSDGNQRPWQKILSDKWYDRLLPSASGPLMELQRNAEFLKALGHSDFCARLPVYLPMPVCEGSSHEPYYVLFPGAGWVNRQWPIQNFAELATRIHQATGWKGFVCGGPGEVGFSRQLREMTTAPLEDKIGQTTLNELACLLASARFLVSNETSAIHLGSAVATRTICILGGGHFGRFMPYLVEEESIEMPAPIAVWHAMDCYGCNWQCIYPIKGSQTVPCIGRISVEQVWKTIQESIDLARDERNSLKYDLEQA